MAITMIIMGIMTVIVISMRPRKLMNRLHMEQTISSHRPPRSIAFHVMIVIHDDDNMAVHHNENNICPYKTFGCFLYKQTTVIWNFHKMPFVCLLLNKQLQFITKMRVVPTVDEHKGGMVKDEQMTLCQLGEKFFLLKTRNWTQRIILKHLKPEDVGMLTLSSFLNATAGGCGHIPDLLLLFIIVVLILVFIVLIVKALICAVD